MAQIPVSASAAAIELIKRFNAEKLDMLNLDAPQSGTYVSE